MICKYCLIGNGGHAKVISDMIRAVGGELTAVLDQRISKIFTDNQIRYSPIEDLPNVQKLFVGIKFLIAIGDNRIRKKVFEELPLAVDDYAIIIHPSAIIGSNVRIGTGSVIMPGTIVNADSVIGQHCIVNSGSVVEHDNKISSFVHISPKAALAGGVVIGEGAHIGIGVSIIPNNYIGNWSVVGAGSVVIRDIPDHSVAVGIPTQIIRHTNPR